MTITIIKKVSGYCTDILRNESFKNLPFHNLAHTLEVVAHAALISNVEGLGPGDTELVIIAAYFHDIGYSRSYRGHEDIGKEIAYHYLSKEKYPVEKINLILSCIEATKMPQQPQNKYAGILCDADMFHIGASNFIHRNLLLRKEWELCCNQYYTDAEWYLLNLKFLEGHTFITSYGKQVLENGKQKNLSKLKQLIEQLR